MYHYHVVYGMDTGRGTIHLTTKSRMLDNADKITDIREYIKERDDISGEVTVLNIITLKKWWEFWK